MVGFTNVKEYANNYHICTHCRQLQVEDPRILGHFADCVVKVSLVERTMTALR